MENKLHLTLDRCLMEDAARRSKFARARALINALAHNLLRRNAPGGGWKVERMLNCQSLDRALGYEGVL